MSQETIKPCPFCGSSAWKVKSIANNYRITCGNCEARAGFAESEFDAIQRWNRREDKQCAELAAENVARGEIIERLIGQYSASGFHAIQNSLNPAQSLLYDALQVMRQPATDAFLAEVRAQGVELAIGHIEQTISPNHETILNEFAAKLRQEAAQ